MGHVFDIGSQWDRAGRDGMTTLSFSLLRSFLLPFVTKSHDDDETCGGTPCTFLPPLLSFLSFGPGRDSIQGQPLF
jgi:hypothetical protein